MKQEMQARIGHTRWKAMLLPGLMTLMSGCGYNAYAGDSANITVLAVFGVLLGIIAWLSFSGSTNTPEAQRETSRRERNWMSELAELRNEFVLAQQDVLDRADELMTDRQKQDASYRRLKLKSHSALNQVLQLQEEMLREGVAANKVNAWEL